jgi:DNA mismatch repair protein MutS
MDAIEKRLDIVDYFYKRSRLLDDVRLALKSSNDAQRALQRLSLKKGQHSDLLELKWTLQSMMTIKQQIQSSLLKAEEASVEQVPASHPLIKLLDSLDTHDHLAEAIANAINEEYVIAKNTKDNREFGFVNAR